MSRLPIVSLAALSLGCASGEATLDAPGPPDAADAADAAEGTLPLVSVGVGGGCDASLETRPNNACDGEAVLGLDLLAVRDASGGGLWSEGEVLEVELELFTTLEDPEAWVNYPGVFAHLPDGVQLEDPLFSSEVAWFYAVAAGQPLPLTVRLVAAADVAPGTELVFTVGSLNCETTQVWGPCPTPSPLTLTVGG